LSNMRPRLVGVGLVGLGLLHIVGSAACGKASKGGGEKRQPFKLVENSRVFAGYRISGRFPEGWTWKAEGWDSGDTVKLESRMGGELHGSIVVSFPRVADNSDQHLRFIAGLALALYGGITSGPVAIRRRIPSRLLSKVGAIEPGKISFSFEGLTFGQRRGKAVVSLVAFRLPDTATGYVRCMSFLWSDQHNWEQLRKVCAELVVKPIGLAERKTHFAKIWKDLQGGSERARRNFCSNNFRRLVGTVHKSCLKLLWARRVASIKKAQAAMKTASMKGFPPLACSDISREAKSLGDPKIIQEVKEVCDVAPVVSWAKVTINSAKVQRDAGHRYLNSRCKVTSIEKWAAPATPLIIGLKQKVVDACFRQHATKVIKFGVTGNNDVCAEDIVEAYRGIVRYKLKDKETLAAAALVRDICKKAYVGGRMVAINWSTVK